jgi:hypothetical protein
MYRSQITPAPRKGIILLVVLALLTLFTIVGITFVLYADAAALQARNQKDSNTNNLPNMSPEESLSLFLDQFIFDVCDDATGVYSSLRGHSLSRNMYGFNTTLGTTPGVITQVGNSTPFIGIGRLHYPGPTSLGNDSTTGNPFDDYKLINYMFFQSDGFLRDPERYGSRAGLSAAPGPYLASANVPYTYPDLNNYFLGAIDGGLSTTDANGNPVLITNLITPSFHREWLFGRLDDPNNPNWTNAAGKYLTVRPRPVDHFKDPVTGNYLFPYPVDRGGDVKNLIGYYGGCDSSWMDIGAPVLTTPDGRRYKMLVAPLILELDGRINLNAHGNNMGGTTAAPTHASLDGLGPWEVNPSRVLAPANPDGSTNTTEWMGLLTGHSTQPTEFGRYGPGKFPIVNPTNFPTNNVGPSIPSPPPYGQIAYRPTPITHVQIPSTTQNAQLNYSCFPSYPTSPGYDNANQTALQNHALLYNYYAPFPPSLISAGNPSPYWNRRFRVSNMERFFRSNDTGFEALTSELERLMPLNFYNPNDPAGSLQRLSLVTPISGDVNQPGISPYIWDPSVATYSIVNPAALDRAPVGAPPVFPTPKNPPPAVPTGSDFVNITPPAADWRSAIVATNGGNPWNFNNNAKVTAAPLPRLDLNNPFPPTRTLPAGVTKNPNGVSALTPYPTATVDSTLTTTTDSNLPAPNQRFDTDTYFAQFQQAQKDRQYLARQIYLRLLAVTGLSPSGATPSAPSTLELQPRRWLAQLAVNMVDYIDNDDISTPFNFYTLHDANPGVANPSPTSFNIGATVGNLSSVAQSSPMPDQTPLYWVFGTELPRVVINEVLMQYQQPTLQGNNTQVQPGQTITNNVWIELYNPMELKPSANQNVSAAATQPVLLGMPSVSALGLTQSSTNGIPTNANAYAAYRILVADQVMLPTTPVKPPVTIPGSPIADNNNVLGLPYNVRAQTTDADFAINKVFRIQDLNPNAAAPFINTDPLNPVYLFPQGFMLVTSMSGVAEAAPATATIAPNQLSGNTNYPNGLIPANGNGNTVAAFPSPFPFPPTVNVNGSPPNLVLQTSNLQFTSTVSQAWNPTNAMDGVPMTVTPTVDNTMLQGNGATVMLQRLVNPHIPWNQSPTLSNGAVNPWYNPYVTIDYISNVPLYNATNPFNTATPPATPAYSSVGKKQPYTGFMNPNPTTGFQLGYPPNPGTAPTSSVVQNQTNTQSTTVKHTFGARNNPLSNNNSGPYNWLTHLDRMLISPVELLHVSQYQPHQLTQKFMLADPESGTNAYQHAPVSTWYNETTRLYRVFEFLETRDRLAGTTLGNRTTGKISINAIWDYQTFLALCDPQGGNNFLASDVQAIWNQLIKLRSPNYQQGTGWYQVGPTNMAQSQVATGTTNYPVGPHEPATGSYQVDRPFLGHAPGAIGSPGTASSQYPNGQGIRDTIFRPGTTSAQLFVLTAQQNTNANTRGDNPYMNHQLLTKIFNNVTTRSNTFAVWLTVGFFEVRNTTTQPVQLGAEMNWSEGRAIRHRMFAVIDRSVLANNPYPNNAVKTLFRPGADTSGIVPYWAIIN